ncbi:hypothetical protein FC34_GL001396 [Lacticaseibacillus brantae DSM 23927]|uniref:Sortase n=1 Tax=Lacticaseibacillus brantae DSM 23927 TaxID=1423727 RepID=A0A0R2B636_9LACO|nr:hypothetical protein FC34_GL001396 [Lacticaseibacillus brantae DSM 23927]
MWGVIFIINVSVIAILTVFAWWGNQLLNQNAALIAVSQAQLTPLANAAPQKIATATDNSAAIKSVGIPAYTAAKLKQTTTVNQNGIGRLYIPQARVALPILAGMTDANLLSGVATYRPTQRLAHGNYVIASHNIFGTGLGLANIKVLKAGNAVYATNYGYVYRYQVSSNQVVNANKIGLLDDVGPTDAAIMTIFRCEGPEGTPYRRVVQAKYTGYTTFEHTPSAVLKGLGISQKSVATKADKVVNQGVAPLNIWQQLAVRSAGMVLASAPWQLCLVLGLTLFLPIAGIMVSDHKGGKRYVR